MANQQNQNTNEITLSEEVFDEFIAATEAVLRSRAKVRKRPLVDRVRTEGGGVFLDALIPLVVAVLSNILSDVATEVVRDVWQRLNRRQLKQMVTTKKIRSQLQDKVVLKEMEAVLHEYDFPEDEAKEVASLIHGHLRALLDRQSGN